MPYTNELDSPQSSYREVWRHAVVYGSGLRVTTLVTYSVPSEIMDMYHAVVSAEGERGHRGGGFGHYMANKTCKNISEVLRFAKKFVGDQPVQWKGRYPRKELT